MERIHWLIITALAASPVIVGGLIYVCFRPQSLLLFDWAAAAGLHDHTQVIRSTAAAIALPRVAVDSLPAGLWAMSGTAFLRLIWHDIDLARLGWLLAVPGLVGVLSELAQATGGLPGTFDVVDTAFYTLGSLVGALIPVPKGEHP